MEYAPTGHFVDALSVSVLNRNWPPCPYTARDSNGWVEISTSEMLLKYKLESGAFTAENLTITWSDKAGAHAWKPGAVDDKNLGGVPGDIAARKTPGNEPGPLSRNGYFFLDDSITAVWNAATQWPEPRPEPKGEDWYVFVYGLDYKRLLRELALLLGPIPMVPRYVFGTWFGSRAGYPADEFERIVSRFREEQIPLDLLVLDSNTTAAVIWHGFSWDPEQFPDPKGFFAWAKARGVKVTINEHYLPITPDSDQHFDEMRQALGLPVGTKEIAHNLADKRYAQLYMDMLHKPALDDGMAFWWQDGWADAKMTGLDPTLWTRHVEYEREERITGKRGFVFCRLGGAISPAWGVHRYGSFFTGDLVPYWSTLELLIPFNVQVGNMLVPYVNNLTAGVIEETLDLEIYQRWAQFSAFAPLFWWHGLWGLRLPWEYGEAGTDTVRRFLTLRYSLIPYIYTYSRIAHETGEPLVRGTWLEYPEQEQAYTFKEQYLFGKELLVAPIAKPGKGQPVSKDVYLPEGEHWFDYFTGDIYPGGQVLSYECPLSRMPLFVRAGSILPIAPDMDSSDQRPVDPLTVEVFPGRAASFRLYEDDGTSLEYRKQAYAWTSIGYTPPTTATAGVHSITIGPSEGRYQGQVMARRYRIRVHGLLKPARVMAGSQILTEKMRGDLGEGWEWYPAERVTEIDLVSPRRITDGVRVTLQQAGAFEDVVALQKVRAYRERIREIKIREKMRWAMLLAGQDIKKQPHVLQVTEQVEQQLNDLVENPGDVATHAMDFREMSAQILSAFVTQPFDSSRKLPELDEEARTSTKNIEHGQFTQEELDRMTAVLLDCRLVASATGKNRPTVIARMLYDTASMGTGPAVTYELALPETGDPGWAEESRAVQPDGTTAFKVRPPFPVQEGTYWLKLRATATWGPNSTVVERDVPWVVPSPSQG
jgi:alpha-glucosidase (family GH31 glycosyl hydrolase)